MARSVETILFVLAVVGAVFGALAAARVELVPCCRITNAGHTALPTTAPDVNEP